MLNKILSSEFYRYRYRYEHFQNIVKRALLPTRINHVNYRSQYGITMNMRNRESSIIGSKVQKKHLPECKSVNVKIHREDEKVK